MLDQGVEEGEFYDTMEKIETALIAVSGCRPVSVEALIEAGQGIGKARALFRNLTPTMQRSVIERVNRVERDIDRKTAEVSRCVARAIS